MVCCEKIAEWSVGNSKSHLLLVIAGVNIPQIKKIFDIVKAIPTENIFENMEAVDAYLEEKLK